MNHSGGATDAMICTFAPALPREKMSNWNWCTISCVRTCSVSFSAPCRNSTFRCRKKSVTPCVPSPTSVVLVCPKSVGEAYRMMIFRSVNRWFRMRESRAYDRSAIRATSSEASRSDG
jgi:hypothetical protein